MPLVVALEMFTGHTEISIRLPIGQTEMSILRPLDEQKCPVDIEMSIGHFAEVLDINPLCDVVGRI